MYIKICGNTTLEDASLAAELGADAVGFIFAPSPRQLTVEQVAAITAHLPEQVERIGVFPALPAEQIVEAALTAGLTGVQLHSAYDPAVILRIQELAEGRLSVTQVLSWQIDGDPQQEERLRGLLRAVAENPAVDRLLVDSKVGGREGGTGVHFDWARAKALFAEFPGGAAGTPFGKPMLVAGGLTPENVADAIAVLHPWGVDVSSGVEFQPKRVPTRKDPNRLREFFRVVRVSAG